MVATGGSPRDITGYKRYYHWYLSVIPRLTKTAGFELGSGMYINTTLPEANAEFLRNVAAPPVTAAQKTP